MARRILACSFLIAAAAFAAASLVAVEVTAAEVTAARSPDGVVLKVDGQPFAEYRVDVAGTPIVWPVYGPTSKPMTRSHPMGEAAGERKDHPHHRSIWFNHGDVNGLSYWHRETIKHRDFVKIAGGDPAVIVTCNDWMAPDGKRVCKDERTLRFGAAKDTRWIDFDVTVTASDGPVKFGDTKEGTMGIRVPGWMKVDAGQGGRIVNSNGLVDKQAWGKPAAWVDYHGAIDGETLGIAVLNHPSSFRYPTHWHVRTYGLFAANPFGLRDFTGNRETDGSHQLAPGETMTLRYRIILHRGDEKSGRIAEAFAAYAKEAN